MVVLDYLVVGTALIALLVTVMIIWDWRGGGR